MKWMFLGAVLMWRVASRILGVQRCPLQWYTITGFGLAALLIHTSYHILLYGYWGTNYLDPALISSNMLDKHVHIMPFPEWLRLVSLFAPLLGIVGFLVTSAHILFLIRCGRQANAGWRLHPLSDQLLIITLVPLVLIVTSLCALIRQWEVMTGSFCWGRSVCGDAERTGEVVAVLGTMDMSLATAVQFYAVWEVGELCGHLMSESKLRGVQKFLGWMSIVPLYLFSAAGLAKSTVELGMTAFPTMLPASSTFLMGAKSGIIIANMVCALNLFGVSKMPHLREARGDVTLKFRGTGLLLLAVQVQAQLFKTDTVEYLLTQAHEHDIHWFDSAASFGKQQLALLDISLVLFWCFYVSVANSTVWKAQEVDQPLPQAVYQPLSKAEPSQMPPIDSVYDDDAMVRHDYQMMHGY